MALNLYVMPITGSGASRADARRPKYASTLDAALLNYSMFDYGNESWCLVGVVDISGATDASLTANADVLALPQNLDQTLGSAQVRNRVSNALENANIPGTWITTSTTWRSVACFIGAVCHFAHKYQGSQCGGRWFGGAVGLTTTYGSLSASVRQCLLDAANASGLDTAALASASTLRQVLKSLGDQYVAAGKPLVMGGVSLYTSQ